MAPSPSAALTLFEPIVYLRGQSAVGQDARGRRRPVDFDAPPSQLRGLLTVTLPKPSKIKSITVTLLGTARTDWPEGIGFNRLELGEESEIHRQTVTLFSARESSTANVGRRRANSLGPGGAVGLGDDIDWSLAPERAGGRSTSSQQQQQRPSSSRSPGLVLPTSSLGRRPLSREGNEARRSPTLARSIGNAAAKATSALQLSQRSRQAASNPSSPSVHLHAPNAQAASYFPAFGTLSPDSARTTPATSPSAARGGSVPPTPAAKFYTDAPPEYEEVSPSNEMPPAALAPSAAVGSMSNEGRPMPSSGAGTPQSVLNAGPGSKSILHAAGRQERSQMAKEQAQAAADAAAAAATSMSSPKVNGAGTAATTISPSTSGMLGSPARLGGNAQTSTSPLVRFDPRDVSAPGSGSSAMTASTSGAAASNMTNAASVLPLSDASETVPASTSTTSSPTPTSTKGKAKAISSNAAASVATSNSLAGRGRKAGIKGLLGGLLREPSETKDQDGGGGGKAGKDFERGGSASHGAATSSSSSQGGSPSPEMSWPATVSTSAGFVAGNSKHKDEASLDWREFRKGTYTYPISIPLPSNLPPTLHADFGENKYVLQAVVHRAGALTPNLYCESEVTLVHAPDEAGSEETDAIIVERTWDDALSYMIVISGKSFPVGAKVPVWAKFVPLGKVHIHRIIATLEEKTDYYAKGRRIARHEVPRRWTLAKVVSSDSSLPILPLSDNLNGNDATSLSTNPIISMAEAAAASYPSYDQDVVPSLFSNTGPWEIMTELQVPAKDTKINISSSHSRSSIAVHHLIKLTIRVEKLGGASSGTGNGSGNGKASTKRQLYDIVIEAPISLNHSHTAHTWLSLPDYWSVRDESQADEDAEVGLRENGTLVAAAASSEDGSSNGTRMRMVRDGNRTGTSGLGPTTMGTASGRDNAPPLAGPSPFRPYMPPVKNSSAANPSSSSASSSSATKSSGTGTNSRNGSFGPGPGGQGLGLGSSNPNNLSSSSSASASASSSIGPSTNGHSSSSTTTRGVSPLVLGRRWLALSALASSAPTMGATTVGNVGVGVGGGGGVGEVEVGSGSGSGSSGGGAGAGAGMTDVGIDGMGMDTGRGGRLPSYSEAARGR